MRNEISVKALLHLSLFVISVVIFSGCRQDKGLEKTEDQELVRQVPVAVPDFNPDSAYYFIEKQVEFGPRIPNTQSHYQAGNFLSEKLREYKAEITIQEFQEAAYNGEILNLKNIIASYGPGMRRRILLAAHWDTRPFADKDMDDPKSVFEGANDGGSGVGVLLEIARILSVDQPENLGIDIILFDGEDYGEPDFYDGESFNSARIHWCLGSQYWSNNKHQKNYMAYYGILLDMVGGRNATFYKEGGSMQYARKIVEKVWDAGRTIGFERYFINQTSPGITDDHIFVNRDAKIPMINIVEYDPESPDSYFGPYHHTRNDNMSLIDRQTLKAVGQTVLYVIFNE